jgi:nucleoside phosphorylase
VIFAKSGEWVPIQSSQACLPTKIQLVKLGFHLRLHIAMTNPHDYTVGWICAIHTEYVAAQAFLDEYHEGPDYVSPNDNNDYTLGKIGNHNIVIAVLPNSEYGLSSAAGVAKDMLHSFPNLRVGLLVGIGGGAPSRQHDIRLGDVVVGVSNNGGKSAVFQYDFGKAMQGQEFLETGVLYQSPPVLRTAVNGLMAQYDMEGNQLSDAVNNALNEKPRLRKKGYSRPGVTTDRLYQSQFVHANNEMGCVEACGDNSFNRVKRLERDEEDEVMVHYGTIASANTLMKDALIRDKLTSKKDVLCFEMEAAGLISHFPCLVIRGICDYSDSHKNDEWQGYAAMVAAAYAKDLLRRMSPTRIEAEKKISEVLANSK